MNETSVTLRHSFGPLIIFGSIPGLALVMLLVISFRSGAPVDIGGLILVLVVSAFLVAWNRGTYVVLTDDTLLYCRFFLLKTAMAKTDIAQAVAIARFDIGARRPPFRVELYSVAMTQPVFWINLKPFPADTVEQLLGWLPNLDRSAFKVRLTADDK